MGMLNIVFLNKFGILTLGDEIGRNILKEKEISIQVDGKIFKNEKPIITHKSVKGRIDGLTLIYKNYDKLITGTKLKVQFYVEDNILKLTTI